MASVSQKEYTTDKIRNIAFIGHGGSGKTTVSEAMLLTSGTSTRFLRSLFHSGVASRVLVPVASRVFKCYRYLVRHAEK